MKPDRPDLSKVSPEILQYIEYLETELQNSTRTHKRATPAEPAEPTEPPTTCCLVTMSAHGAIKRTYRHLYNRQRRGGMGIFDLDTPEDFPATFMALVDESEDILFITDFGRGYRLPVKSLPAAPIRDRGQFLKDLLTLQPDEQVKVMTAAQDSGYLAVMSDRGYVRLLRHNYLGSSMRQGTPLFDVGRFGPVAAGNWTTGEAELFIATRKGKGIRFREKMIHANGSLGIRLDRDDLVVGVVGVTPESGVLLVGSDGKGTIRLMEGFASNKAPGSGGKIAMKTDHLIGAVSIKDTDDIFAISRLSKVIRFQAIEIPSKTGVVQGVNCMALRSDDVTAITVAALP